MVLLKNVLQEEIFLSHRLTEILIRFTLEALPAGSNSLETWDGYVKQLCFLQVRFALTGGTAVTGQICAQVNANVLNSAIGLNGHVSDCYGKNGQGALIGTNTEQTLTTGGVLTAEQMKNPNSYKGWSF
mgnify:CR=1 FL=1